MHELKKKKQLKAEKKKENIYSGPQTTLLCKLQQISEPIDRYQVQSFFFVLLFSPLSHDMNGDHISVFSATKVKLYAM